MALGAVRVYFRRGENDGIRAAADLTAFAVPKRPLAMRLRTRSSLGNYWTR
jgi:hypothetical protein